MQRSSSEPAPSGGVFPAVPEIIFSNWREELHRAGLSSGVKSAYALAVSGYLDYCSLNAISVTTASARAYMEDVIRRGLAKHPALWKEGLNWFFRTGRGHCAVQPLSGVPSLGQADTGAEHSAPPGFGIKAKAPGQSGFKHCGLAFDEERRNLGPLASGNRRTGPQAAWLWRGASCGRA
jgi:hypothetical protein